MTLRKTNDGQKPEWLWTIPFFCNANYMCLFTAVKSAKCKITPWNESKSVVAVLKADVQLNAAPDSVDQEILSDRAQCYAVHAGTVPNWLRIYLTNWEISQHVGTSLKNETLRCFLRQHSVCAGLLCDCWWYKGDWAYQIFILKEWNN